MTQHLCKDCIHSRISYFDKFGSYIFEFSAPKASSYMCSKKFKPEKEIIDPVIGTTKEKSTMTYCSVERKNGNCGPTAKYWQPKHKKDLFKMFQKDYNV